MTYKLFRSCQDLFAANENFKSLNKRFLQAVQKFGLRNTTLFPAGSLFVQVTPEVWFSCSTFELMTVSMLARKALIDMDFIIEKRRQRASRYRQRLLKKRG